VTELPIDDATALCLAAIEALEDADDLTAAGAALVDWDADGRYTYNLEEIDADLDDN
jgi:hypothetical protein